MVARNHHFYFEQQRGGVADWLIVGVARTSEGAEEIRLKAVRQLADRCSTPTAYEIDRQIEEDVADLAALEAGIPLPPPKPPSPPWWISSK